MKKREKPVRGDQQQHHEYPLPGEIDSKQRNQNRKAQTEADRDITNDPDLSSRKKNDDLDEGETARLGEGNTDLV